MTRKFNLNSDSDLRKKQRGQNRKLKSLCNHIDDFIAFENTFLRMDHFHVPSDMFIQHLKTSCKVKKAFCQKWIDTTSKFISLKPVGLKFCKVVALISVPYYWDSQIIIFYDESYYNTFWDRNTDYQKWELIERKYSFIRDRGIQTSLSEQGYTQTLYDEDITIKSTLWFYGDIPK